MNCPKCGEEILHENATFCPSCGESLEVKPKRSDYVLVAAVLTIVAAAFSAGLGYIAFYQYTSLIEYYAGTVPAEEFLGFLIFGIPDVIASAIAIAGSMFMLKRKFVPLSILGAILPLVSAIVTFITIEQYDYGYTDSMLLAEVSIVIFAILSTILVFLSRDEFK